MSQDNDIRALASASALAEIVTVESIQRDPDGRVVVNNISHEIRPFTFRQFFKVIAHVERILEGIGTVEIDFADPIAMTYLAIHAISVAGEDVQAVIGLSIGKPVEYFDTLTPDDGIKLCLTIFKVNKDFFVQKIQPMLPEIKAEAMTMAIPKSGETS